MSRSLEQTPIVEQFQEFLDVTDGSGLVDSEPGYERRAKRRFVCALGKQAPKYSASRIDGEIPRAAQIEAHHFVVDRLPGEGLRAKPEHEPILDSRPAVQGSVGLSRIA